MDPAGYSYYRLHGSCSGDTAKDAQVKITFLRERQGRQRLLYISLPSVSAPSVISHSARSPAPQRLADPLRIFPLRPSSSLAVIIRRQADARRGARTGEIPTPILKSSGGSPVVVHGVTGGD